MRKTWCEAVLNIILEISKDNLFTESDIKFRIPDIIQATKSKTKNPISSLKRCLNEMVKSGKIKVISVGQYEVGKYEVLESSTKIIETKVIHKSLPYNSSEIITNFSILLRDRLSNSKNSDILRTIIDKRCGYESSFCNIFSDIMSVSNNHHYDSILYDRVKLEFKKSKCAFWIPEVRAAELVLNSPDDDYWTLFIGYNKNKIKKLAFVLTNTLIQNLNISEEYAISLIERNKELKKLHRTLHSQQSYGWDSIEKLSNVLIVDL